MAIAAVVVTKFEKNQMHLAKRALGIFLLVLLTGCTKKQEPEKESKIGRLDADEKVVAGLPAERQTILLPLLLDLKQQVSGVEAGFREYRDAPFAKEEEARGKIQKALEKLNTDFTQLDAKVGDAEVK